LKRIPCVLLAALFLALVLPGCVSGLDPTLMELQVKPLSNFSTDAADTVPDVEKTIAAAEAHAATLAGEPKATLEAALAKVKGLFNLPKVPNEPFAMDELRTAARRVMETIRKGGDQ
jgi:hypothetical protein